MTAKEMFEELGYKQTDKFPTYIEYLKKGKTAIIEITFDLEDKRVIKEDFNTGYSYYIKYDELQAINKQVEELGWK